MLVCGGIPEECSASVCRPALEGEDVLGSGLGDMG